MIILPTMRGVLGRSGGAAPTYDTDAQAWFDAVEATGANFGPSAGDILTNKAAFSDWFAGCKTDGIWTAIKAGCFLRGPSTLTGALVPFVGSAPTNNGFVDADYNRLTGLIGNGSSKYLDSNRANNADPQNDRHVAVWVYDATVTGSLIGGGNTQLVTLTGPDRVFWRIVFSNDTNIIDTAAFSGGFYGMSRTASATVLSRRGGATVTRTNSSTTPTSDNIRIFSRTGSPFSSSRLSFYSIGEALTLSLLDARLTTLFAALV